MENSSNKIMNAIKLSAIAEHLVNKQSYAENVNFERLKITKSCNNVFYLVKMKVIWFLNKKPSLNRQKKDHSVALFT